MLKLELDQLPIDERPSAPPRRWIPAWEAAGTAGEDYELCVCVPRKRADRVRAACEQWHKLTWMGTSAKAGRSGATTRGAQADAYGV